MIHHSCKENEQMHEKCKNRRTNNANINFGEKTDIYGCERAYAASCTDRELMLNESYEGRKLMLNESCKERAN